MSIWANATACSRPVETFRSSCSPGFPMDSTNDLSFGIEVISSRTRRTASSFDPFPSANALKSWRNSPTGFPELAPSPFPPGAAMLVVACLRQAAPDDGVEGFFLPLDRLVNGMDFISFRFQETPLLFTFLPGFGVGSGHRLGCRAIAVVGREHPFPLANLTVIVKSGASSFPGHGLELCYTAFDSPLHPHLKGPASRDLSRSVVQYRRLFVGIPRSRLVESA